MERPTTPLSPELRGICLSLAAAGTALVASAAFAVCAARLGGLLAQPLPPGVALAVVLLTAAWCASTRAAWLAGSPQALPGRFHLLIAVAPLAAAILLARSLTFSPLSEFSTFLLWFAVLAEEAITLGLYTSTLWAEDLGAFIPQRREAAPSSEVPPPVPAANLSIVPAAGGLEEAEPVPTDEMESEPEETCELPPGVTQQLTRATEGDQEQIHGLVRAQLVAGQRHAYVHLGFCPPLPALPHVELHQLDGPEAQIKTGQILTGGVRFDLKLREAPATEQTALFEFLAVSSTLAKEANIRTAG